MAPPHPTDTGTENNDNDSVKVGVKWPNPTPLVPALRIMAVTW